MRADQYALEVESRAHKIAYAELARWRQEFLSTKAKIGRSRVGGEVPLGFKRGADAQTVVQYDVIFTFSYLDDGL